MKNKWFVNGNHYTLAEISSLVDQLESKVYKVTESFMGISLELLHEKFDFQHELVRSDDSFVQRVVRQYNSTTSNLGVLLNGPKGIGKTVNAKRIANALGLPVLMVLKRMDTLGSFLNRIPQNVTVMVDEYEKVYPAHDTSLLTIMDGMLTTGYKRVFILTTNELTINENLKDRPSRIRYVRSYESLDKEAIVSLCSQFLTRKERLKPLVDYLLQLSNLTIDMVKAYCVEVNVHDEHPSAFQHFFNAGGVINFDGDEEDEEEEDDDDEDGEDEECVFDDESSDLDGDDSGDGEIAVAAV